MRSFGKWIGSFAKSQGISWLALTLFIRFLCTFCVDGTAVVGVEEVEGGFYLS